MNDRDVAMQEKNYLFIHIPKTAGRSIVTALGLKVNNQHKTVSEYVRELGEAEVRKRFKFTSVRNPWDRAVSWWSFFGNMGQDRVEFETWLHRMAKRQGPRTPLDQMSYCRTITGEILIDHFIRFEHLEEDFAPVADRLGLDKRIPHIGRRDREHQKQMREAMLRAKRPEMAPLIDADDYHDMYKSRESIDIVADLDAETIKRFGYSFK